MALAVIDHKGGQSTAGSEVTGDGGDSYLDLGLGHAQRVRQPGPLGPRQVLGLLEGLLQGEDLVPAEGGPRVFLSGGHFSQRHVVWNTTSAFGLGYVYLAHFLWRDSQ